MIVWPAWAMFGHSFVHVGEKDEEPLVAYKKIPDFGA